jgi:transcription-repair coupling factor (superfamily II helicase)
MPDATQTLFRAAQIKLRATQLGIRKINMGPSNGYLLFDEHHKVDPKRVLKLIQSRPKEYRLDGAVKLRFAHEARSEDAVFAKLRQLLDLLA